MPRETGADGGVIKNYARKPNEKEIYNGAVRIDFLEMAVNEIDIN